MEDGHPLAAHSASSACLLASRPIRIRRGGIQRQRRMPTQAIEKGQSRGNTQDESGTS